MEKYDEMRLIAQVAVVTDVVARLTAQFSIATNTPLKSMHAGLLAMYEDRARSVLQSGLSIEAEEALATAADELFRLASIWAEIGPAQPPPPPIPKDHGD